MLTLERIDVAIAGTRVLRGVDMVIDHSGRVALVGRNGAGKTTTLRSIMGLVPLSGGRIGFEGQDLSRVPAQRRTGRKVGGHERTDRKAELFAEVLERYTALTGRPALPPAMSKASSPRATVSRPVPTSATTWAANRCR